ncbi:MAG: zinc ribbon domain-containing protein, partial [Ruminococcus sp.]|nr:zinc ribbon domain-containing protein [Ruminococcus sp.]
MERKCSSCGARISDGMKICANCGKVVPPLRTIRPANSNASMQGGSRKNVSNGNLSRGKVVNGQRVRTP